MPCPGLIAARPTEQNDSVGRARHVHAGRRGRHAQGGQSLRPRPLGKQAAHASHHSKASADLSKYVVEDGLLITGQNRAACTRLNKPSKAVQTAR
jgi:hypothetical protein